MNKQLKESYIEFVVKGKSVNIFASVHRVDDSSAGSITKFQWFWLNMEFSGSGAEEGRYWVRIKMVKEEQHIHTISLKKKTISTN